MEATRIMPLPGSIWFLSFSILNDVKQVPKFQRRIFQELLMPTPFRRHLLKSSSKIHLHESYQMNSKWAPKVIQAEITLACFTEPSCCRCFSPPTETTDSGPKPKSYGNQATHANRRNPHNPHNSTMTWFMRAPRTQKTWGAPLQFPCRAMEGPTTVNRITCQVLQEIKVGENHPLTSEWRTVGSFFFYKLF